MNRPDISRLNKNRNIFLKIGLMTAICMVIFAFNITVYDYEKAGYIAEASEEMPNIEVVRTYQDNKPKPPPPVIKASKNIIPDDQEFIEEPLPESIESEIVLDTQAFQLPLPKIFNERPKPSVDLQPKAIIEDGPPIVCEFPEQMPQFPGCEDLGLTKNEKQACADKALLEYIYSKIKYPEMAAKTGIEGTVVAEFIVEKTGEITGINIIKEIGGGCGKEVVRVVEGMPRWLPGKQRGREVRVRFKLPVKFQLQ